MGGCGLGTYTCFGEQHCRINDALITSVNFPFGYEPTSDCRWQIVTDPGTYISVTFNEFDVPGPMGMQQGCVGNSDRVQIRDGGPGSRLLAEFCNMDPPLADVYASFNEMSIIFTTDDIMEGKGFEAEYHATRFTSTSHRIQSTSSNRKLYNSLMIFNQKENKSVILILYVN